MKVHEADLSSDLQGSILKPAEQTGWGVVVLAGSSGRVDVARAKLFAGLGAVCIALRWFGGERQPPGICEVPLEVFTRATDRLIDEGCERVAYVGTSKGAEAALLIAADDPRVSCGDQPLICCLGEHWPWHRRSSVASTIVMDACRSSAAFHQI